MIRFASDLKFGFRMFLKHPGFSLLAVFALGLGIHLVTNQLLVINAFLFRGPDLPEAERLVDITRAADGYDEAFHPDDLAVMAARQSTLDGVGGFYEGTVNVSDRKNPLRFQGGFISWDFHSTIGVQPILGRALTAADAAEGAPPVILISHQVWKRDFRGDPTVIGRSILINAEIGTIVGVMPEGVRFPLREDVWLALRPGMHGKASGEEMFLRVFGKLKRGVDHETARLDLDSIATSLAKDNPKRWVRFKSIEVEPFHRGFLRQEDISLLWVMLAAVLLVLVIACANVANLLLARSTVRGRELAVRSAVGASRPRLIVQMLVESLVLCFIGSAIGVFFTVWSADEIGRWFDGPQWPYWFSIKMDARVLAAVFGITCLCACVAGIVPAVKASRTDLMELLNETGRTSTNLYVGWFGRTVIGVQVAMAFALLIVAGMLIRTISQLRDVKLPRPPSEVLSARFGLFDQDVEGGFNRAAFLDKLLETLDADPAVQATALTTRTKFDPAPHVPVATGGATLDPADTERYVFVEGVTDGFLKTVGAEVVSGRGFEPADFASEATAVIVNESFARRFFPDADPLGETVEIGLKGLGKRTIVGVVSDLRMNGVGFDLRDESGLYLPLMPAFDRFFTVLLRTDGDARRLESVLRRTLRALHPDLPLYWVQTYEQAIQDSLAPLSRVTTVFLVFGMAAVLLAAIGIYGVVSFMVSQRTPEIGIRMALGARSAAVIGIIVRQGAMQLVVGLLSGTALALALGGVIRRFVVAIGASDVTLFALVGVVLSMVVIFSSLLPARRAVQLTPLAAMRHE